MKKLTGILAVILVLTMVFALASTTVLAARSVSGYNKVVTVDTGKRPWYAFMLKATVTVKNTGGGPMSINVEDSRGRLVKKITSLKAGVSQSISLEPNSTYTIYWSGNALAGYSSARGTLSAGRYISDIY